MDFFDGITATVKGDKVFMILSLAATKVREFTTITVYLAALDHDRLFGKAQISMCLF